jgi:hypothetical protein
MATSTKDFKAYVDAEIERILRPEIYPTSKGIPLLTIAKMIIPSWEKMRPDHFYKAARFVMRRVVAIQAKIRKKMRQEITQGGLGSPLHAHKRSKIDFLPHAVRRVKRS